MRKFWVHLDIKGQVKFNLVNETNHRSLPWCLKGDSFPTLGKKKGYIDEYGPKTPNCTKAAAFVCQNVLTCTQINLICFLLIKDEV